MQPLRRSTRLREQPTRKASEGLTSLNSNTRVEEEDSESSMDSEDEAQPRKRKRKSTSSSKQKSGSSTSKRRRAGKLRELPEMPMDILLEIFGHLLPYDLLRLSRTTKTLRHILMNRSSISVWKHAGENVPGLPPCPPQLSEPAYANLVFGRHCHNCGAPGAKFIYCFFFKRFCKTCDGNAVVFCYMPEHARRYLASYVDITEEQALEIADCLPWFRQRFLKQEMIDVFGAYASMRNAEEKAKWRDDKKEEIEQRFAFADACEEWLGNWISKHEEKLAELRDRRSNDILDRLRQEGWDDVIDEMDTSEYSRFEAHKLVKQNKDLTDRIWKNIKPAMIDLFTSIRATQHIRLKPATQRRRVDFFRDAFDQYCRTLPHDAFVAPIANIVMMDSVQALINDDDRLDFIPSLDDFFSAFAGIPEATARWKQELDQHLCRLLSSLYAQEADYSGTGSTGVVTPDNLHLATSLFKCTDSACTVIGIPYRRLLMHTHGESSRYDLKKYPEDLARCFEQLKCTPVELSRIVPMDTRQITKYLKTVFKVCGLPDTATMVDLDRLDPFLECLIPENTCPRKKTDPKARHALSWLDFFHGCFQSLQHLSPSHVRVLEPEDPLFLKLKAERESHNYESIRYFACMYCYSHTPMDFKEVQQHLSAHHNIVIQEYGQGLTEHYSAHRACRPKWTIAYHVPDDSAPKEEL